MWCPAVQFSCIDCFLFSGDLYLYEYGISSIFFLAKTRGGTYFTMVPDPPEHVLDRAYFLLDQGFGVYDLFKNNCEHFSIYCKTGLRSKWAGNIFVCSLRELSFFSLLLFSSSTSFIGLFALGYEYVMKSQKSRNKVFELDNQLINWS
jgi:hypothetical protein